MDQQPQPPPSTTTGARSIWRWLDDQLERYIISIAFAYFCTIILIEVMLRYALGSSLVWGEMTARYAFVYLVMVAAAEASRNNLHVRIDLIPSLVSDRARLWLYLYFDCLQLVLAGLVAYFGLQQMGVQIRSGQVMPAADVNIAFAYFALPLGWTLLAWRTVQGMRRTVETYRKTGRVPLGGVQELT